MTTVHGYDVVRSIDVHSQ